MEGRISSNCYFLLYTSKNICGSPLGQTETPVTGDRTRPSKTGLAETGEANSLVGGRKSSERVSMKLSSHRARGGPAQLQRGSAGMDTSPTLGANLLQIIIKQYHIFQRLLQVKKQQKKSLKRKQYQE